MKLYKKKYGLVYINSTFNNTITTLTRINGSPISWVSSGSIGYKGAKKSTSLALQIISEKISKIAIINNIKIVDIFVKGYNVNKEIILRIINNSGLFIRSICDITPIPHNGCRFKKKRRV